MQRTKQVERLDRLLQVHHQLAALLVAPAQLRLVVDALTPFQPPPSKGFMNSG
jgi:hypothetical protein